MMYQLTMQEVTYQDYSTQHFSNPSSEIKQIDIIDIWDSVLSKWIIERPKRPDYHSLLSLLEIDLSSIWPHFEIKTETSAIEEARKNITEIISEDELISEMVEEDFVVRMPTKKRYKIHVVVRNVKKGKPRVVEPDEILF